jgi:hypothetical protein
VKFKKYINKKIIFHTFVISFHCFHLFKVFNLYVYKVFNIMFRRNNTYQLSNPLKLHQRYSHIPLHYRNINANASGNF